MKKIIFIIFTCILLLFFSTEVQAARGDLIYEVEKVVLSDDSITISGYAFIHRTHNYVTVYERDENGNEIKTNPEVKSNGGQKVRIKVSSADGTYRYFDYDCINDDYNFYYQMYTQDGEYSVSKYNDASKNICSGTGTKCYYEDIGFKIVIPIKDIIETFSYEKDIWFEIAATNNDYGKWTKYKSMKIANITGKSDNIEIVRGAPNGKVKFTAELAQFQEIGQQIKYTYDGTIDGTSYIADTGSYFHIFDLGENGYKRGFLKGKNICYLKTCFVNKTYSPGKYAVCANLNTGTDACSSFDSNGYCTECNVNTASRDGVQLVAVYGSWIELEGTNQLIIKINGGSCDVVTPSSGDLNCNGSKTFSSTCDTLTVSVPEGTASVRIEQEGTISSVLTPDNLFAGGGFNFGVMYYNTIKWSYVNGIPNSTLHSAIKRAMEDKIYNYNEYVSRINITQLKIGNRVYDSSFLEKKCTTSSNYKNYYNNELTVSCVFSFPESILHYNGDVEYKTSTGNFNINNKYYTPIDYSGTYKLEATIEGMSRITDSAAINDSSDNKAWTGAWSDTFKNCEINLYSLLLKNNGKYNFIYRPIDINNPFPNNRIAGINWYDWISVTTNQDRIKNTYKNSDEYYASFDNKTISEIKKYNKNHNYLNWDNINENGNSSFITDNNYINKGGGNQ